MINRIQFPNPQKIREKWIDLNGEWDFAIPDEFNDSHCSAAGQDNEPLNPESVLRAAESIKEPRFNRKINVPYSYTFPKSGVNESRYYPVVWYRKQFSLIPEEGKRYLLNFEAVDYACDIWLNDSHICHHQGGHTPFCCDITPVVQPENRLVVKVVDFNLPDQPIGKQSWKRENFAVWYTKTIGIWQSVWIEETGDAYLTELVMTPKADECKLEVNAQINSLADATLEYDVTFNGIPISKGMLELKNGKADFDIGLRNYDPSPDIHLWSPATPDLYDVLFTVTQNGHINDTVLSYFGLRDITTDGRLLLLNDQKYYLKLLLNQGYYKDGGLTGTAQEIRSDIEKMKAMGFNGNRIHQKIESNRALYLFDSLGFITWAEFPSGYEYGTSLVKNIEQELPAFLAKHVNHPSVFAYVLMNESWGVFNITHDRRQQLFVDSLYYQAKAFDPTRLVIGNDGYEQVCTDICTIHDYNENPQELFSTYDHHEDTVKSGAPSPMGGRRVFVQGYEHQQVPVMITEYGGVAYERVKERDDSWGYGERISDPTKVVKKIADLTKAVMDIDYCVGFCYTQTSDVEQEINGLLDHNHEYKFDPATIRKVLLSKHTYGYVQI